MNSQEWSQPTEPNRGGLAPEHRQCRYVFAHGRHCRRWAIRGHEYCHGHLRWEETHHDGPIEVPLMEDPSAVQLVTSQTVRALAWGHIPPDNGRAALYGCRLMQIAFAQQLAEARFRLKCHQLGLDPNHFLHASSAAALAIPSQAAIPSAAATPSAPVCDPNNAVILSEAERSEAEPKDLHFSHEAAVSTQPTDHASIAPTAMAVEAPAFRPGKSDEQQAAALAAASAEADVDPDVNNTFDEQTDPTPHTLAPTPSSHPLDDIPPAPRAKSVCEPCVAALVQGADESLIGCKTCPAHKAGNLRAPKLPDPRNPPETPHESTPIPPSGQPAFRDLKTKWESTLDRLGRQRAEMCYPRYGEAREDFRAARRERPFADFLHHYATAPPPPIPPKADQETSVSTPVNVSS